MITADGSVRNVGVVTYDSAAAMVGWSARRVDFVLSPLSPHVEETVAAVINSPRSPRREADGWTVGWLDSAGGGLSVAQSLG